MGPGYDGAPFGDPVHGRPSGEDLNPQMDRDLGNRSPGLPRPNGGGYGGMPGNRPPASPALSMDGRDRDAELRRSEERNRSRQRAPRTASGQLRTCKKCGEPLTGQFVRALDGTFHLDCFRCRVGTLSCGGSSLLPQASVGAARANVQRSLL